MPVDVTTVWVQKMTALRAGVNLDLTTAIMKQEPTVRASASSASTDLTTKLRDYYADPANPF